MHTFSSAVDEVKAAFFTYLETFFSQRDLDQTIRLFDKRIAGFGTARDESATCLEEFYPLYKRDIEQAPERLHYSLRQFHVHCPSACCGIAYALLDLSTTIARQKIQLNGMRLSTVFHKETDAWLLVHMHFSLPTTAHGDNEAYPVKELEKRDRVLERMVEDKTAQLNDALEKISFLASKDKLTGLHNRLKLDEHLEREINRSQRYLTPLAVILLDVDRFKSINDTHGHLTGDRVLASLASLLQHRVRKADILGRWGGEEFLLLCPETTLQDAASLAEALRRAAAEQDFDLPVRCTISLGVTVYAPGDSAEALIGRADKALYAAKDGGRNLVVCRSARIRT